MGTKDTNNLFQDVTHKIIKAIEASAGEYRMPWHTANDSISVPTNPIGKYHYHGINILCLWVAQRALSFRTNQWATYRQWASIGAQVRRGETGTTTVFFKPLDVGRGNPATDDESPTAGENCRHSFVAKAASVFNADQVDGFCDDFPVLSPAFENATADGVINNSGARILWGGDKACYLSGRDEIHLPVPDAFQSPEAYYGVAFHELTHWTGHDKRCARDLTGRFGSASYAMEELVAELGAAFLSAKVGVSQQPRIDHAQYMATWLSVLRDDSKAIFAAAAKANQASTFIMALTAGQQP